MFCSTRFKRAGRVGIALVVGCAFGAVPVAANASQIDLGTAKPFAVLGGSAVTNTGNSVIFGDLGVSPGTSLPIGPMTVNGATHNNDAVAASAQLALTNAYTVAAGQPILSGNDLSTQDLGGKVLPAGAYKFSSGAQLTGPLILDAENDPNAQFVFEITSALTTASASSVSLINGGNPCNVYWQVGSDATLGTTTQFIGNLMALSSISVNDGVHVQGRLLARNAGISMINDVVDSSMCFTGFSPTGSPTPAPGPTTPGGTTPTTTPTTTQAPPASQTQVPTRRGTAILRRTPGERCTDGFHARVRGSMIRRVVFTLDGRRIATRTSSPFSVFVRQLSGTHSVRARVTFRDATRAKTLRLGYRACAAAVLQPRRGPSQFTG